MYKDDPLSRVIINTLKAFTTANKRLQSETQFPRCRVTDEQIKRHRSHTGALTQDTWPRGSLSLSLSVSVSHILSYPFRKAVNSSWQVRRYRGRANVQPKARNSHARKKDASPVVREARRFHFGHVDSSLIPRSAEARPEARPGAHPGARASPRPGHPGAPSPTELSAVSGRNDSGLRGFGATCAHPSPREEEICILNEAIACLARPPIPSAPVSSSFSASSSSSRLPFRPHRPTLYFIRKSLNIYRRVSL
jgi:hypothetical protein